MTGFLITVIVLLLVVVGVLLARRRRPDPTDLLGSALAERAAEHARAAAGPPDAAALRQQVLQHLAQQQKILAVKAYRDATGAPLAEAVRAVEQIAAGAAAPAPRQPLSVPLPPDLLATARQLTQQGRKIEAVKVVRQRTGLTLREAKDVVDSL
ncbi:ribosomal protein L7/L12 [Catellatospora sp. NPDC049609]|uniref:ribosomal protein L7/L12 n=1 Tax=Catellatospora sp. NPDC049609 TaxID=3155505 RepID=UPI00342F736F